MNAKIISNMINKKVIVCFLGIFVLSAVDGQRRWQYNDDDEADSRSLRHHQHQQQIHHQIEDVTQGADSAEVPYSQTVNLRHHNRHHQHRRYTITTSRTTTKPTTTTTEEPVTPNPEEHRLRHSNKLYQPYAMVELKERHPQRRRSNVSAIPPPQWERPIPPQHYRQSVSVTKKSQNLFNVSTVMKNRYFDRDGLYTIRHTTTTTPPPPARIRHPYDILKIPYKNRIRPLKKANYNDLSWEDEDDNSAWDTNYFDDGDEMDDEEVSSWNRQGRSKKTTKQLKSTGRKVNIDSEEFDIDEFDENDEDDDDDNVDDVYTNRKMRNQHSKEHKVSFQ